MRLSARQGWDLLKCTWKEWNADDAPRIGAALAYYTVFSIAPLLVIATGVAGLVFGPSAAQEEVSRQLESMLGPVAAEQVETMLANAHQAGGGLIATIVGAIVLLVGATSVFVELQDALNSMWDAPPRKISGLRSMLRARGLSFAMILVIGFLLLVSLILSAAISALSNTAAHYIELPELVLGTFNFLVSTAVITGLFALLYKVLPDVKIAWGDVWVGGLVTAALFSLGKWLIGLYLGHSSVASAYGAAGSLAVLLVWVYYSAQLVLFGAEFTQVYARRHGSRVGDSLPADAARQSIEQAHAMAREQEAIYDDGGVRSSPPPRPGGAPPSSDERRRPT